MEMPEGQQRQPNAALNEAAIWYLRSKSRYLSTGERHEFASWLRRSPENVSAFFLIKAVIRRAIPGQRSASKLKQALIRVLRLDRVDALASSKRRALSLSYYRFVKQQHLYPKIGLLAVALGGVAGWMLLNDLRPLRIAAVAIACCLLLLLRESVVGLRVAKGYFGSTESEVRDFVKFISACRSAIDFTDEGGKRRPSLDSATSAARPSGICSE